MADAASTARSMWTLFEPVHAVIYFAPEARSACEEAGLRGFWRGYFAGRAAPLGAAVGAPAGATAGAASAAVVTASFFNFAPAFVARAIPGVWDLITPADALRVRLAGATEALRRLLAGREADAAAAADLLWRAIGELDFSGRVLAAANVALPVPESVLARLWQAATVLREHRGDGHCAALAAADIDGCEAVALRCCVDLRREDLQPVRGWTDEAWDEAPSRLAARGWIGADGELTGAGREAHAAVENAADWAAARPWTRLGPEATAELVDVLTHSRGPARACCPTPVRSACPGRVLPGDGQLRQGLVAVTWGPGRHGRHDRRPAGRGRDHLPGRSLQAAGRHAADISLQPPHDPSAGPERSARDAAAQAPAVLPSSAPSAHPGRCPSPDLVSTRDELSVAR